MHSGIETKLTATLPGCSDLSSLTTLGFSCLFMTFVVYHLTKLGGSLVIIVIFALVFAADHVLATASLMMVPMMMERLEIIENDQQQQQQPVVIDAVQVVVVHGPNNSSEPDEMDSIAIEDPLTPMPPRTEPADHTS